MMDIMLHTGRSIIVCTVDHVSICYRRGYHEASEVRNLLLRSPVPDRSDLSPLLLSPTLNPSPPYYPQPKAGKSKQPAPAPYDPNARSAAKTASNPLFAKRVRVNGVGGDLRLGKRDLGRYVRWPKYVRLQRQRRILYQRLKVPPSINQFSNTLDKSGVKSVLKLANKYRPETAAAKKERLRAAAGNKAAGKSADAGKKPITLKYGLNHVVALVEQKKASLVLIAHDVDPIELVLTLPALCRKMDVPYAIVKGKALLGQLVHQKTAAAVALTGVRSEDKAELGKIVDMVNSNFAERYADLRKQWGGHTMGTKSQHKQRKIEAAIQREQRQKMAVV
eukprot:TRINITY_DN287_c0_g1_i1.p1 TRINITY_DN287_c0_g1~~TRINITY_DN287_c0_g1_i1.p1  ORF type:complete len:335 (+),score=89.82 TRINITY_DN287_c0_g1_i1:282-1286(+)